MKPLFAGNLLAGANGNDPEALVRIVLDKGPQLKPQMKIMGADSQRLVGFLFQSRRKADHPEAAALQRQETRGGHFRIDYPDAYSDAVLDDLQAVIEAMHSEWGSTQQLLERPTGADPLHLAEVDHGLLVEPPAGKENGWVPIVLEVELPDGTWQQEIDFREGAGGLWTRDY